MASSSPRLFSLLALLAASLTYCYCQNETIGDAESGVARVTWYGDPEGPGSTGGACGYGSVVANPPLYAMVSAGGSSFFKDGHGCGTCYQVVCNSNPACSGNPITVTIADECPTPSCEPVHFDLSGKAMGALANPGQANQLRSGGVLQVNYIRTPCLYQGTDIAFHIDVGANQYYMAFVIEFVDGDGDLATVEIQPAGGNFISMQEMRSAVWNVNSGSPLRGPFSIRLTSGETHQVVVAQNVIPENWKPDETYRSVVNFN